MSDPIAKLVTKNQELVEKVEHVAEEHGRFKKEGYFFVFEALQYTVNGLGITGETRHVTGHQLLDGIRGFALEQFGPMSKTVFEHWGISRTRDFGEIVFDLVNAGLMGRTDEDTIDDFVDVYDFDVAFDWRKAIGSKFKES
jgi:uncharacterized repeat protein (TIGR04138 family)